YGYGDPAANAYLIVPLVVGGDAWLRVVLLATGELLQFSTDGLTWQTVWLDTGDTLATFYPAVAGISTTWGFTTEGLRVYDGAVPRPLVLDTFTRGNSASALGVGETGHAWTVGDAGDAATLPTWGISGNTAYLPAAGDKNDPQAWVESGLADGIVDARVTVPTAASGKLAGLLLRRVDAANYLWVQLDNANDTVALWKCVAGVRSLVNSAALTLGDGQTWRLTAVLSGSGVHIHANTANKISWAVTDCQAGTKHGLWGTDAGGAARWDTFSVWG
ncbi:MAG TPA: hypothetical protein VF832_15540, partial [Longimicrobiales bacterium]